MKHFTMPATLSISNVVVRVPELELAIDDVLERTLNAPAGPAVQETVWEGLRLDYGYVMAQAYRAYISLRRRARGLPV